MLEALLGILLTLILFWILSLIKSTLLKPIEKHNRNKWESELTKIKQDFPSIEKDLSNFSFYLSRLDSYQDKTFYELKEKTNSYTQEIIPILQRGQEIEYPVSNRVILEIREKYEMFLDYKDLSGRRNVLITEQNEISIIKKKKRNYWKNLSPKSFEEELLNLFKTLGYKIKKTPYVADGGIDGIIEKPNKKIVIQCKKHKKPIGVQTIRDMYGTLMHSEADEGWVISVSGFSSVAYEWVKEKPIKLFDIEDIIKFARTAYPEEFNLNGKNLDDVDTKLSHDLLSIDNKTINNHGYQNLLYLKKIWEKVITFSLCKIIISPTNRQKRSAKKACDIINSGSQC